MDASILYDYLISVQLSDAKGEIYKEIDENLIPYVSFSNGIGKQKREQLTAIWINNPTPQLMIQFTEILSSFSNLSSIKISGIHLTQELITKLCSSLTKLKNSLRRIQIEDSKMKDEEINILSQLLIKCDQLQRLSLSQNKFTENSSKELGKVIINTPLLTHLNLSKNEITDDYLHYLNIKNVKTLRNIELSFNKLTSNVSRSFHFFSNSLSFFI